MREVRLPGRIRTIITPGERNKNAKLTVDSGTSDEAFK